MGLFDLFKKKNATGLFTYNEQTEEYTALINGIEFSVRAVTPEIVGYAKNLAEAYERELSAIADFMLKDEAFDNDNGIFPNVTKEKLIASLGAPDIRLLSDKDGACTYCNHTLDDIHIIVFEFLALFDDLYYLTVDG